jgi:hypothetical protein
MPKRKLRPLPEFSRLVFLFFLASCASRLPRPASEALSLIDRERNLARSYALAVQRSFSAGSEDYVAAEHLYEDARTAFNRWLEQAAADLHFGEKMGADTYNEDLDEPVRKNSAFCNYSRRLLGEAPSTESENGRAALLGAAVLRLWDEYRDQSRDAKANMVLALQALKWPPFAQEEPSR